MSIFSHEAVLDAIRTRGALRTPGLALAFHLLEADLDAELAPLVQSGQLIACDVELPSIGKTVKEYRLSMIGGGKPAEFTGTVGRPRKHFVLAKVETTFGAKPTELTRALNARFHTPPPRPTSTTKPAQEAAEAMSTTDKIIAAITKHGPKTTGQLGAYVSGKHVSTICAQLARAGRLVRLGGGPKTSVYGLKGQELPAAEKDQTPKHPHVKRKAKAPRKDSGGGGDTLPGGRRP